MTTERPRWTARWPLSVGFVALGLLVGVIGYWSVTARIAGAGISSGMIQVESNRQVVQHPDGGVVGEILAKDGDTVEAGQVLLRLDDTLMASELTVIEDQLDEIAARKLRFTAERDDADRLSIPTDLSDRAAADPDLAAMIAAERQLFEARRSTLGNTFDQLEEQILQTGNQIKGAEAQLEAQQAQLELIAEERSNADSLLERGLAQASRVSALRREEAQLKGQSGALTAQIAQLQGRIAALRIEKLRLATTRQEEALSALRDLSSQEVERAERARALRERLSRMELRAPVSGVVWGSRVFARQSVVTPADPVLYIIPQDQPLVVAARIEAIHIDQVHVGQEVALRFTAFDQRMTPEIIGQVARLSADVFQDEVTGVSYYSAEMLPHEEELEKLGQQQLLPGMPVEAYIKTAERSPLSYLAKPLTDYFNKAFRES